MRLPLTKKEEDILAFVYGYIDDNKYSPTRQEIGDKFGMSKQAANCFIGKLVDKGKLKILANKWRNIEIV